MEKGIIISSVVLSNAFKEAGKVKTHNSIPITEYFMIECQHDKVFLVKTNLEDTIKIRLNCEWNFAGSFLLTADVGALMSKIEEQPITVKIRDEDFQIVYVGGEDFSTNFAVDLAQDYITHESGTFESIGAMDYTVFRTMIEKLAPFLSTDELREETTGFCFNNTHAVATNGHMLRYIPNKGIKIKGKDEIIVRNILPYLPKPSKNASYGDVYFDISTDFKIIKIEFEDHVIYSRLIDERYPAYKDVIPQDFSTEFSASNSALKQIIDQALLFANKTTGMIKINVNDQLEISAEDLDFNKEFNRKINYIQKSGEDILFAINGKKLLICIKHLDDKIKFQLKPDTAIILNDEILLMPIQIN